MLNYDVGNLDVDCWCETMAKTDFWCAILMWISLQKWIMTWNLNMESANDIRGKNIIQMSSWCGISGHEPELVESVCGVGTVNFTLSDHDSHWSRNFLMCSRDVVSVFNKVLTWNVCWYALCEISGAHESWCEILMWAPLMCGILVRNPRHR